MKNIFKPEHFAHLATTGEITQQANVILAEYLGRESVRVYGHKSSLCGPQQWVFRESSKAERNTHTALLINIEPIAKVKCVEHVPRFLYRDERMSVDIAYECRECGTKLRQVFEEVNDK